MSRVSYSAGTLRWETRNGARKVKILRSGPTLLDGPNILQIQLPEVPRQSTFEGT